VACENAVIPNAVGVDIGCGMAAVMTDFEIPRAKGGRLEGILKKIMAEVRRAVPLGEGKSHGTPRRWKGFDEYSERVEDNKPGWMDSKTWNLATRGLGTLGGGNHFIEIQRSADGTMWLMLHSGSRNLGYKIASWHHKKAVEFDKAEGLETPNKDLAWFPADSAPGREYVRDMSFAADFAAENRARMLAAVKEAVANAIPGVSFPEEINIHHNYAALERHAGMELWVHRKGATRAGKGELGIIPGSMGTASYIVEGLGNPASFESCSHGAGRRMGRNEASRRLDPAKCDADMRGVIFDGWNRSKRRKGAGPLDLSEAPAAYKDIGEVMKSQKDLVVPLVRLTPLAVLKG